MSVTLQNAAAVVSLYWSTGTLSFKGVVLPKVLSIQYDVDTVAYTIFAVDDQVVYVTSIYLGDVPDPSSYSQAQNDADKTDFVTNYLPYANGQIDDNELDPRLVHRFGNLTSIGAGEVLVSARPYAEPASQAERSFVSTSASDTGDVRLTYLDSNYVRKTVEKTLTGTTPVNTGVTDIRFVEKFQSIRGAAAVGAIKLMTLVAGGGTEICGIGAGTEDAFLCHHYVPAGMRCWILGWNAQMDTNTASTTAAFKLKGQQRFGANLVDQNLDLRNLFVSSSTLPMGRNEFARVFEVPLTVGEKCYIRVNAVPSASGIILRSDLDLWEDKA